MIQKTCKFSLCHGKGCICILCDSFISIKILPTDPVVPAAVFRQNLFHRLILRASIGNAQFPVLIGLCDQRIYHLSQKLFRRTIRRNHHTDKRRISKPSLPLFVKDRLAGRICRIPGTIGYLLRLEPFMEPNPELLWTVVLQIKQSFLDHIWR